MDPVEDMPESLDSAHEVNRLRAQLHDVASELRPVPTFAELRDRIGRVRRDMHQIEQELQLVLHLAQLEDEGIMGEVEEIERQLDEGWVPPSRPVEDVVEELRAKYG
jgi:hypothetical protein